MNMFSPASHDIARPRVGISRCLLGEAVRYDGGHRRQDWLLDVWAPRLEIIPLCPEIEIGLGVPRPPIRVVQVFDQRRVRGVTGPQLDVTRALQQCADHRVLQAYPIDAWILKARSPSCGVEDTPVFDHLDGRQVATGAGMFTERLMLHEPYRPMSDEQQLHTEEARDHFLERLFVYRRWRQWFAAGSLPEKLYTFHARLGLHLEARAQSERLSLDNLAGQLNQDGAEACQKYLAAVMGVLNKPVERQAMVDALRQSIDGSVADKRTLKMLLAAISAYEREDAPLAGVIAACKQLPQFMADHFLLDPEPAEWLLRHAHSS